MTHLHYVGTKSKARWQDRVAERNFDNDTTDKLSSHFGRRPPSRWNRSKASPSKGKSGTTGGGVSQSQQLGSTATSVATTAVSAPSAHGIAELHAHLTHDLQTSFPIDHTVNPCDKHHVTKLKVKARRPSIIATKRVLGTPTGGKLRVPLRPGIFRNDYVEYIAAMPPRAALRLEYLLGTNKVRLNDRAYMRRLHEALVKTEYEEMLVTARQREKQERERVKKLVIECEMPPPPDMRHLYNHPMFKVNAMLRRLEDLDALFFATPPPPHAHLMQVEPFEYDSSAFFKHLHRTGRFNWVPKPVRKERRAKLMAKIERARERKRLAKAKAAAAAAAEAEGAAAASGPPYTLETVYSRGAPGGRVTFEGAPGARAAAAEEESSSGSWVTATESESSSEYTGSDFTYTSYSSVNTSQKSEASLARRARKHARARKKRVALKKHSKVTHYIVKGSHRGLLNPEIMEDIRAHTTTTAQHDEQVHQLAESRFRKIKECYGISSGDQLAKLPAALVPDEGLACLHTAEEANELYECARNIAEIYLGRPKPVRKKSSIIIEFDSGSEGDDEAEEGEEEFAFE